ncbi:hypothetical protein BJ875DRAFT_37199 [Amylocarpus encephaloides]|uniref:Uncharacterized protein n=1 Tax=Amylocarpus encephaloides TaxID=45428 RepID=A0A9P7YGY0_9HELO|nr:hypothetical protein BJ875DRAFT_37199 [Amylocarpus encephaloides]
MGIEQRRKTERRRDVLCLYFTRRWSGYTTCGLNRSYSRNPLRLKAITNSPSSTVITPLMALGTMFLNTLLTEQTNRCMVLPTSLNLQIPPLSTSIQLLRSSNFHNRRDVCPQLSSTSPFEIPVQPREAKISNTSPTTSRKIRFDVKYSRMKESRLNNQSGPAEISLTMGGECQPIFAGSNVYTEQSTITRLLSKAAILISNTLLLSNTASKSCTHNCIIQGQEA